VSGEVIWTYLFEDGKIAELRMHETRADAIA
jgi:hypothetical protein